MLAKYDASAYFVCLVVLILLCVINDSEGAYKIAHGTPLPVLRNAPYIYRGQVFILRETDDPETHFSPEIVNGGIEMVMQPTKPIPFTDYIRKNDSLPDTQEDPEYFAVLVTPETATFAQISRSEIIKVPLSMLLTGVTKRMPWVLVLKRKNHFEYFRNLELQLAPIQVMNPQRRRSRATQQQNRNARLVTDSQRFDLLYNDKDKAMLQNICANVIEELAFMTSVLNQYSGEITTFDLFEDTGEPKPPTANNNNKTSEESVGNVEDFFAKHMASFDGKQKSQKSSDVVDKRSH